MKTYLATFLSETAYAEHRIRGNDPADALRRARQRAADKRRQLDFESYDAGPDTTPGVDQIEIRTRDGTTVAAWRSDDLCLRQAADELLDALELCVDCLSELARLDDGTPSISALALARAAIAKAKGGAA